jgi:hypothetical protein
MEDNANHCALAWKYKGYFEVCPIDGFNDKIFLGSTLNLLLTLDRLKPKLGLLYADQFYRSSPYGYRLHAFN